MKPEEAGFRISRRIALRTFVAGAAWPLLGGKLPGEAVQTARPAPRPLTLGVATVSLKGLPLEPMLAAVKRVGLDKISVHRAHSPWENQPGQWKDTADNIRAAGVTLLCCGVLYLRNDEPAMRRMMGYVKTHGLDFFSCSPEPAALPLLEKLVKEFGLRCAIHNHGPEDKSWPSVAGVMKAIEPLDPRVGLCLDVGHCYRSGEDPIETIGRCRDRLYDVHLKDTLAAVGDHKDTPVEMGRGKLDLAGVVRALAAIDYRGSAWLEYEKDPSDPVTGLAESAGYVRGLVCSLT